MIAGLAFGIALWAVNIGLGWPLWINYVGLGAGLAVPHFAPLPLVGHVVYGAILEMGVGLSTRRQVPD